RGQDRYRDGRPAVGARRHHRGVPDIQHARGSVDRPFRRPRAAAAVPKRHRCVGTPPIALEELARSVVPYTSRRPVAHRVSSCRLESWSLRSTAETWVSTVLTEIESWRATSLYA